MLVTTAQGIAALPTSYVQREFADLAATAGLTALEEVVTSLMAACGLPSGHEALKTVPDLRRETLASLSLYIGRHAWTQLTTEEKETLADAVDAELREGVEDVEPVDRWWHD